MDSRTFKDTPWSTDEKEPRRLNTLGQGDTFKSGDTTYVVTDKREILENNTLMWCLDSTFSVKLIDATMMVVPEKVISKKGLKL